LAVGRICDLRGGGVGRNFEPPDVQGDSVSDTAKEEKEEEEEESTACVIREALALLQLWDPSFRPQATAAAVTVGRCAAVIATAGTMPATAIIVLSSSVSASNSVASSVF
jgi:hypothetical protein